MGFEPTPPKRLVPKTSALDRSAIQPGVHRRKLKSFSGLEFFLFSQTTKNKNENSPTGIRTRVVWVKTTYPDQLDYWGCDAPAGNQTRVSSVAGTYTITVLPAHVFVLGFEPRNSRVLGERHNQARPYEHWKPPTRIELVTLRLLSACSAN